MSDVNKEFYLEIFIICVSALVASGLTLFSGFGLGTLLMPVFAIFFPLEIAIAMTALVHLANNIFKIGLIGRKADRSVVVRFGLPAMVAAFAGALFLTSLVDIQPIYEYRAFGQNLQISRIKIVIGMLIILFVALEISHSFSKIAIERKWLPVGGIISGFFGGLSGHQGAFRSMFLIKAGLEKEAFVATGVILAVIVDLSRMVIYGSDILAHTDNVEWLFVVVASVSAFVGAYAGKKILTTVTIRAVQVAVSILLVIVAVGLITGFF
jgi:hypothetical protein